MDKFLPHRFFIVFLFASKSL